jgi:hypothetical protein
MARRAMRRNSKAEYDSVGSLTLAWEREILMGFLVASIAVGATRGRFAAAVCRANLWMWRRLRLFRRRLVERE